MLQPKKNRVDIFLMLHARTVTVSDCSSKARAQGATTRRATFGLSRLSRLSRFDGVVSQPGRCDDRVAITIVARKDR